MGIRFIYGRAGTGKSYTCIEEIYEKSFDNKTPLILIVPEQLSFRAEKALIERIGATGINNVHLLSFKRLAFTIFNEVGGVTHKYMNDTGKAIIVGRAIDEAKDKLSIFKQATKQKGFIDKIIGVLTEFKRHKITPQTLKDLKENVDESSLLVDKLSDIEAIYSKFQDKLSEGYFDPEDNLTILKEKIEESRFLKGAEVWIDEFSGFTPQQYDIIGKLLRACANVNITIPYGGDEVKDKNEDTNPFYPIYTTEEKLTKLAQDYGYYPKNNLHLHIGHRFKESEELSFLEENYFNNMGKALKVPTKNISIFKAQNPYGEVEYVAKEILKLVREKDFRYKDIIVISRDLENYKDIVRVIFEEYEIPFFIDDKEDIASNPLVVYITSLLNIFSKGFRDNSIVNYFKSGFANLSPSEVDLLENYVLEYGIKTRKKWIDGNEEYWRESSKYENIIEIKNKGIEPLIKLEEKLKGKHKVKDICSSIYKFLVDNRVYENVNEYIEKFKRDNNLLLVDEYSSIWNMLIELLDQFVDILGEEVVTIEEFNNILSMGISHNKMGLIPTSMDQVVVGSAERIKAQEVKVAIVVGVNDGVLPRITGDEGLFNDNDRIVFKNNNISVADNSFELAFGEQYLIYNLLSIASNLLYITYPIADLEGKTKRYSMVIPRLKALFPNVLENTDILKDEVGEDEKGIVGKTPTFNNLIKKLHEYIEKDEITDLWKEIYRYYYQEPEYREKLLKVISGFTYKNHIEAISKDKIRQLYGKSLSVSKIEAYANCSFGYFVKYGLKAKERKIYTFAPLDFGNLIHEGLEKFSKRVEKEKAVWGTLDKEFCERVISDVISELINSEEHRILKSSKRYEYIATRVKRILYRMVLIINEQMERGTFQPMGYEISFGFEKDDYYPPIPITLSTGEVVKLQGKIDRVDKTSIDGVNYYRVVDYKTGKIDLDINDVYNGLKIQLLTYLDAILTLEQEKMSKKPVVSEGKGRTMPGAMVYLSVDDPIMDGSKKLTMENLEEEVLKALKMKGIVIRDLKVIKEMDKTIEKGGTSSIIPVALNKPKKGSDEAEFSKNNSSVITYEGFNVLRSHMKEKVREICEDMLEGIIEVTPCKNGKSYYCEFCEFSSICQFDETMGINNFKVMPRRNKKELLQQLEIEGKGGEGNE
ncbi:helicase-exonuclease AddAB subunit AddB [Clostridium sulfidigenes]|uniref:helicase-exonuclease AddAB subunit AddB n=1 Tax=Clostridium sulfidigenes TaxID=318464 RepID=UPI003F8BC691